MTMCLNLLIKEYNYPVEYEGKKYMNRAWLSCTGNSFHWKIERDQYRDVPVLGCADHIFSYNELKMLVDAFQSLTEKEYELRARLHDEVQEKIRQNKKRATSKQLEEIFRNAQMKWEQDRKQDYEGIVWRLVEERYFSNARY